MENHKSSSGAVGGATLLLIAFIVLKLCGVIHWSWAWVLSPLWISAALVAITVGVVAIIAYAETRKKRKKGGTR